MTHSMNPGTGAALERPSGRVWRSLWMLASLSFSILIPSLSQALSFQVDFRASNYQVQASDSFASLLAQHESETLIAANTLDALQGISAPVYAGGVNTDYSILMTIDLSPLTSGTYVFQVGTDWGRGGASIVFNKTTSSIVDEFVTTDDIWWANNWNNPDVFTTTVDLAVGSSYTLGWIGFEGCCGGEATIRYSFNGSAFQVFDSINGDAIFVNVPQPGVSALLGIGLIGLAVGRRG